MYVQGISIWYVDGFVQDCSISNANALEIPQSSNISHWYDGFAPS